MFSHESLFRAITNGDIESCRLLMEELDKEPVSDKNYELLQIRRKTGNIRRKYTDTVLLEILEQLFRYGVSPNEKNNNNSHPLSALYSVMRYKPGICKAATKLFVKYGLRIRDLRPMYSAINYALPGAVKELLNAGYDPDIVRKGSRYLLNADYVPFLCSAVSKSSICRLNCFSQTAAATDTLQILLDSGADPNIEDKYGQTPLFYCGESDTAELLLRYGADVNYYVPDSSACTPLHQAIEIQRYELAQFLVHNGAKLEVRNNKGATPFLSYMRYNSWASDEEKIPPNKVQFALFLVEHGADIYAKDSQGWSIFDINSTLIAHIKELYEHVQLTYRVQDADMSDFVR